MLSASEENIEHSPDSRKGATLPASSNEGDDVIKGAQQLLSRLINTQADQGKMSSGERYTLDKELFIRLIALEINLIKSLT